MACAHPVAVSMQFKLGKGLVPVYLSWVPIPKIHVNQVNLSQLRTPVLSSILRTGRAIINITSCDNSRSH